MKASSEVHVAKNIGNGRQRPQHPQAWQNCGLARKNKTTMKNLHNLIGHVCKNGPVADQRHYGATLRETPHVTEQDTVPRVEPTLCARSYIHVHYLPGDSKCA